MVRTSGVATGSSRRGFSIQSASARGALGASSGLFVLGHDNRVRIGAVVEVEGKVVDFVLEENDRPTTELVLQDWLERERRDSNAEPPAEAGALPIELRRRARFPMQASASVAI